MLLEVVLALDLPARLAGGIHGGQHQGDENANDGDDHQKLNERKTRFIGSTLDHGEWRGHRLRRGSRGTANSTTLPYSMELAAQECKPPIPGRKAEGTQLKEHSRYLSHYSPFCNRRRTAIICSRFANWVS